MDAKEGSKEAKQAASLMSRHKRTVLASDLVEATRKRRVLNILRR